jgi:hypothetical protein
LARVPDGAIEIFPPSASPLADSIESIDEFDAIDVFGVFVTDL